MGKTIVCPCHDVTVEDIRATHAAGYTHPETLKRATAAFMGPCQGKHCAGAVMALLRELTGGRDAPVTRRPTARPPLRPVALGLLAAAAEAEAAEAAASGTGGDVRTGGA
ncbi:(2Fe-2S)-binding protein [Microtetraspora niveoalba]|uniref:(2Fe-2S)-binding protein n=1 Tax=Microtetraspora niveoalba TaxID=46175 RepID=UPI00082ABAF0|nr:(2Fe-2S)-binding protein [Microtetraspora niveoalba]